MGKSRKSLGSRRRTKNLLLDISPEVGAWHDHGTLGFALDPKFEINGYFYVLYVVDRHHLLYYGTALYSETTNLYSTATIGRLTVIQRPKLQMAILRQTEQYFWVPPNLLGFLLKAGHMGLVLWYSERIAPYLFRQAMGHLLQAQILALLVIVMQSRALMMELLQAKKM